MDDIIITTELDILEILKIIRESPSFGLLFHGWSELAFELRIPYTVTQALQRQAILNVNSLADVIQAILMSWFGARENNANLQELTNAMRSIQKKAIAEDLSIKFKEYKESQQKVTQVMPMAVDTPTQPGPSEQASAPVLTFTAPVAVVQGQSRSNVQVFHVDASQHDVLYKINYHKRGKAVIFSHLKFDTVNAILRQTKVIEKDLLNERKGTGADVENLEKILIEMNFEVKVHEDLKKQQIFDELGALQRESYPNHGCLLVIVLSHGDKGKIYCEDGFYNPQRLWSGFTPTGCPGLIGKPKIFLLQACRGSKVDHGVQVVSDAGQGASLFPQESMYTIPTHADFFIAFSAPDGYVSYRNIICGSWLIQSVTDVFRQHWQQLDFQSMMTIVIGKIALQYEREPTNQEKAYAMEQGEVEPLPEKQMPTLLSTLTRILFFNRNQ